MRLWSLHPRHLDRAGLIACWREALLAQAVLAGRTKGYRQHPQLQRFRSTAEPVHALGAYLNGLVDEADARDYTFDRSKIIQPQQFSQSIGVSRGQLDYEWGHLGTKLERRSPGDAARWRSETPTPHPLFTVHPGGLESWERA